MSETDVVIAGGGFAGLACAKALAQAGIDVTLLERKHTPGMGMHTTGIIVKECADEFAVPAHLTRKVTDVRLYAPSLRFTDLQSADYFFLTTDTPGLMRFFSDEAINAGATVLYDTPYIKAKQSDQNIIVQCGDAFTPSPLVGEGGEKGYLKERTFAKSTPLPNPPPQRGRGKMEFSCRFLIGADGPRSKVADDFALGQNRQFLLGAEAEYEGLELGGEHAFYCFLDQKLAHGYLGWVIPGVGVTQVGLAQRMPRRPDIDAFVARMKDVFDFSPAKIVAHRGGLIPVGGLVEPFARGNVLLLGDAAGIVSPLTAGGIHTALHYGKILGETIALHLRKGGEHPAQRMARIYPRFHFKQLMRKSYETLAPNWLLDLLLTNPLFRYAASDVFFRAKKLK